MEAAAAPDSQGTSPMTQTPDHPLAAEVQYLRLAVLVLGVAMLLLSTCFGLYIYKQNNLLIAQLDSQTRLLNQNEPVFENTKQRLTMLLRDLQGFSQTHSDLVPILVKYNFVKVQPQPGPFAPGTSP